MLIDHKHSVFYFNSSYSLYINRCLYFPLLFSLGFVVLLKKKKDFLLCVYLNMGEPSLCVYASAFKYSSYFHTMT